jgi:hypothetical protein
MISVLNVYFPPVNSCCNQLTSIYHLEIIKVELQERIRRATAMKLTTKYYLALVQQSAQRCKLLSRLRLTDL